MIKQVLVEKHVLQTMRNTCRRFVPNESGGIFLGYRKDGAIHIVQTTIPSMWDVMKPARFVRSAKMHRIRALREWKKSNHQVDWIGEWHSHPRGSLNPSPIDHRNWRKITKHTGNVMVFAIVNTKHCKLFINGRKFLKSRALTQAGNDLTGVLFEA